jgi:hypothetical protein
MEETLEALGADAIDELSDIVSAGHLRYMAYSPTDQLELDIRAQAACTYCHMLAEAGRRLLGRERDGIRPIDYKGNLKLWLYESANVVIRLKKMDEDGKSRNYPTKQARKFDAQLELPDLPLPPVRLTAGYWLDATGQIINRVQIARPNGISLPTWCAAVIPKDQREAGERIWTDVTRQRGFGGL